MRTVQITRPHPTRGVLAAGLALAGLTLTACSAGAGSAPADTTTSAAASSPAVASTSTPAPSSPAAPSSTGATPTSGSASAAGESSMSSAEEERPTALPASLFEEGGMTAEEFAATPAGARVLDVSEATSVQEALGTGSAQVTYSAEPDTEYWVHVLCPEGATGGAEIRQTAGGSEERIAWSEWCGLIARPPVTDAAQPQTLRAVADDSGPIRIVVIASPAE